MKCGRHPCSCLFTYMMGHACRRELPPSVPLPLPFLFFPFDSFASMADWRRGLGAKRGVNRASDDQPASARDAGQGGSTAGEVPRIPAQVALISQPASHAADGGRPTWIGHHAWRYRVQTHAASAEHVQVDTNQLPRTTPLARVCPQNALLVAIWLQRPARRP